MIICSVVASIMTGKQIADIAPLLLCVEKKRGSVTQIANRLGDPGPPNSSIHEWLRLTPKDNLPKPVLVQFPKPPKAADGSLLYDRVPNRMLQMLPDTDVPVMTSTNTNAIEESKSDTRVGLASSTSSALPSQDLPMDIDSSTSNISVEASNVIISDTPSTSALLVMAPTSAVLKRKLIGECLDNVESEFKLFKLEKLCGYYH